MADSIRETAERYADDPKFKAAVDEALGVRTYRLSTAELIVKSYPWWKRWFWAVRWRLYGR